MKLGVIVQTESKQTSSVVQEFSRFAHQYDTYNMIQAKVAITLISKLEQQSYENVIDIGCGSGEVYKNLQRRNIEIDNFIVLDSSEQMLALHPKGRCLRKICANFNDENFLSLIPQRKYDLVLSSSALQWSTNLPYTMNELSLLSDTFYGAVFTSGTFKTLHQTADVKSPIYSTEYVQNVISQYYEHIEFEIYHYRLEFNSTRDMFRYIKQSGVSSGERKLSYKETKHLMEAYPLNYLEFEVLLIKARK